MTKYKHQSFYRSFAVLFSGGVIALFGASRAIASPVSLDVQFEAGGISVAAGTGTAGVVPVTNSLWNVEANSASNGSNAHVTATNGDSGTLSWTSTNLSHHNVGAESTPAEALLTGWLDDNASTASTATLTLPASIAGTGTTPYDVYVYIAGDTTGRTGSSTVNGTSATLTELINNGSGTYVETGPSTAGNYYEFTNVVGTTLHISNLALTPAPGGDTFPRLPLNGIQVVALPEPASLGFFGLASMGLLLKRRRRA